MYIKSSKTRTCLFQEEVSQTTSMFGHGFVSLCQRADTMASCNSLALDCKACVFLVIKSYKYYIWSEGDLIPPKRLNEAEIIAICNIAA